MKKPVIVIWNFLISLSLVYYAIFLLMMVLGVVDLMDTLIPSKDLQNSMREILSLGMILFWIYLAFIPLGLTGILRIDKKLFIPLIVLVSITILLFLVSEST